MVFTQKLFVPDGNQSEQENKDPSLTNGFADNTAPVCIPLLQVGFVKQFKVVMVSSGLRQDGTSNCKSIRRELSPNSEDESPATVKFIKMSCKYFTDGMVNRWQNLRFVFFFLFYCYYYCC